MRKVYLQESNIISPLGLDVPSNFIAVKEKKSAIQLHELNDNLGKQYCAQINQDFLSPIFNELEFPKESSRIEKIAIATLSPLIKQHPIHDHSLLIISTTKGNINALAEGSLESALIPALGNRIASYFGFRKEPLIVSNACVSGLMALALAKRYLQMVLAGDVYILAFDELTVFTLSGFHSFQALSTKPCKPYDKNRDGVSLGEAAVASYINTEKGNDGLLIAGESSINDANHISGPSRTGEGLFMSIQNALKEAQINPNEIDYVVGHGTATLFNDEMEAIAFNRSGIADVPTSSLKGNFGHTLAASGLLECVLMGESIKNSYLLPSKGFEDLGTSQFINVLKEGISHPIQIGLKTASGFAGTNTALLLIKD